MSIVCLAGHVPLAEAQPGQTRPERMFQKLGTEVLQANMKGGLVLTSSYSGLGTAEIATGVIYSYLHKAGLADGVPPVVIHSACDSDQTCRDVLLHHRLGELSLIFKALGELSLILKALGLQFASVVYINNGW